jgi:hypothetical protein
MSAINSRLVEIRADKGEQLTLSDLRRFIAELDNTGAADTTPIAATVGYAGKLRGLQARAVRLGDL